VQLRAVLVTNRGALERLFYTGTIFTRSGARIGRDLLLAHQQLLAATSLLARLERLGEVDPGAAREAGAGTAYDEIDALLARTSELSARSEGILARDR